MTPADPLREALVNEFASLQRLALAGETGECSATQACGEIANRLPDLLGRALATKPAESASTGNAVMDAFNSMLGHPTESAGKSPEAADPQMAGLWLKWSPSLGWEQTTSDDPQSVHYVRARSR